MRDEVGRTLAHDLRDVERTVGLASNGDGAEHSLSFQLQETIPGSQGEQDRLQAPRLASTPWIQTSYLWLPTLFLHWASQSPAPLLGSGDQEGV